MYSNVILKDTKYIREMITLSKILLDVLPISSNSNDHTLAKYNANITQPEAEPTGPSSTATHAHRISSLD